MKISPEPVGDTKAEKLANSYLSALRSHQYSTVDGYVSYCPPDLQDEIELLIGQRMRHVMACQRMANAFRNSEVEVDQIIVRLLDEPVKVFASKDELTQIAARIPKEAVVEQAEPTVFKLTNGSLVLVEE